MGLTPHLLIDYNFQLWSNWKWFPFVREWFFAALRREGWSFAHSDGETSEARKETRSHTQSSLKGSLTLCSRIQSFEQLQLLLQVEEWPAIYTWSSPMATRLACAAHMLYQNIPRISLEYSGTFPYKFHTVLVQSWYVSSHQECTSPLMYNIGPFSTSPYIPFVAFTTRFITLI